MALKNGLQIHSLHIRILVADIKNHVKPRQIGREIEKKKKKNFVHICYDFLFILYSLFQICFPFFSSFQFSIDFHSFFFQNSVTDDDNNDDDDDDESEKKVLMT